MFARRIFCFALSKSGRCSTTVLSGTISNNFTEILERKRDSIFRDNSFCTTPSKLTKMSVKNYVAVEKGVPNSTSYRVFLSELLSLKL